MSVTSKVSRANGTRLAAAGFAVVIAGLATGCGSGNSSAPGSGSQGGGTTSFAQCLKQHGVTLPSGQPGQGGQPPSGGQGQPPGGFSGNSSAMQACSKYAPKGSNLGGGGFSGANFTKFVKCLKTHGVKVKGSGPAAFQGLNRNSSKVQQAIQACQGELQQP